MIQNFFLDFISNPFVVYILLILGIYLLIFGISTPGTGIEIAAAICLILAIVGIVTIGIDIISVVLFIIGIMLFIVETQTEGSFHGTFSFGGIVCIIFGGVIFLQSVSALVDPSLQVIMWVTLMTFTICLSIVFGGIALKVLESKRRKSTEKFTPSPGDIGVVKSEKMNPTGQVYLKGEDWSAECVNGVALLKGEKVKVVKIEGIHLIVSPVED